MTGNLLKRVDQHKNDLVEGFTAKYGVHQLVYYQRYHNVNDATKWEKQLKKWNRQWKIELIKTDVKRHVSSKITLPKLHLGKEFS